MHTQLHKIVTGSYQPSEVASLQPKVDARYGWPSSSLVTKDNGRCKSQSCIILRRGKAEVCGSCLWTISSRWIYNKQHGCIAKDIVLSRNGNSPFSQPFVAHLFLDPNPPLSLRQCHCEQCYDIVFMAVGSKIDGLD